jgi:hypothetical protein
MAVPVLGVHVRERDNDLSRDRQDQAADPGSVTDLHGDNDRL